jgi:hypothetical protein
MRQLELKEIPFSNHEFWWFLLAVSYPNAGDDRREEDFMEVVLKRYKVKQGYWDCALSVPVSERLTLHVEVEEQDINYYFNDLNIGRTGGDWALPYLRWDELLRIAATGQGAVLFHLLLPLVAIPAADRAQAQTVIAERLADIGVKGRHRGYFAECLVSGLYTGADEFAELPGVGLVNTSKHSLRDYADYPNWCDEADAKQQMLVEANIAIGMLTGSD